MRSSQQWDRPSRRSFRRGLLQDHDRVLEGPIGRRPAHEVDARGQLLAALAAAIDLYLVASRRHVRRAEDRPDQTILDVEQVHLRGARP